MKGGKIDHINYYDYTEFDSSFLSKVGHKYFYENGVIKNEWWVSKKLNYKYSAFRDTNGNFYRESLKMGIYLIEREYYLNTSNIRQIINYKMKINYKKPEKSRIIKHGFSYFYNRDGSIDKIELYKNGHLVKIKGLKY
ncbi:hypothetical protein K6119_07110 [Paracrocinitomix mangrovi]|uniref:hypothetical protein n=1 Tax=Paracrocinitomix mangrovi TaxID=2862509 RepID=UPI001C8E08EC|nr:hypothetical protein [Paracrocinitomix mangrovi]UKN03281.1 hypothetical protein K6119_07110 [Paracrocinitomix mangrovi]